MNVDKIICKVVLQASQDSSLNSQSLAVEVGKRDTAARPLDSLLSNLDELVLERLP